MPHGSCSLTQFSHFSVKKPLHQKESLGSGKGKICPENDLFLVHSFR